MVQTVCRLASGRVIYSSPVLYQVPAKPTPLKSVDAQPGEKELVTSFESLGSLIDPLKEVVKDCEVERHGAVLTIKVPAGVRLNSSQLDVKKSPMMLADVDGDFIAQLKVSGHMIPGTDPPRWKGKDVLPGTYQGAGLVLFQDTKNYVRLERGAEGGPRPCGVILRGGARDRQEREADGPFVSQDQ